MSKLNNAGPCGKVLSFFSKPREGVPLAGPQPGKVLQTYVTLPRLPCLPYFREALADYPIQ